MAQSSSAATSQLWFPPPTQDPNIDLALQTAFQQIYANTQQSLQAVSPGAGGASIASGVTSVTGSQNGVATGLAVVTRIVASIEGSAPLNQTVSARVSPGGGGAIDLFVWMPTSSGNNTPIPSTTPQNIHWVAYGTPKATQQP